MKFLLPFIIISFSFFQSCSRSNTSVANETPTSEASVAEPQTPRTIDSLPVPEPVFQKFISLFPTAKKVEWDVEDGGYEASFQWAGAEKSVLFTPEGEDISSETEINVNSLPESMTKYIASHFQGKKIDEAVMTVTRSGGITFEIEVEGKDYVFDGSGNFLKIEQPEPDEEI